VMMRSFVDFKYTNKRGQKQARLHFAEREYLGGVKNTNKPGEKSKLACIFSEAKYLGRSQRYEKISKK
ncbi:MAG: hypothetical protein K2N93_06010, partial [Alistipes sp.]|nr:hypothetical protein [Alistipes sp.]